MTWNPIADFFHALKRTSCVHRGLKANLPFDDLDRAECASYLLGLDRKISHINGIRDILGIMLLISLFLLGGCDGNPQSSSPTDVSDSERNTDSELSGVEFSAAALNMQIATSKDFHCHLAQFWSEQTGESGPFADQHGRFQKREAVLCRIFKQAEALSFSALEEIRETSVLKRDYWVFSVFQSEDEGGMGVRYSEHSVGLFTSEKDCKAMEQRAHDHGIPTRVCRQWQPPVFEQ